MDYAISSESMKLSDENTIINNGVSAITLMDRASHAIFNEIIKDDYQNIAVVCGSGNNGGDGYSLSLKLLDSGKNVTVYGKEPKTESSKYYFDILIKRYKIAYKPICEMQELDKFDLVVDCLLGIGITGELSEEYIAYIKLINKGKYIISCDIPSGLNSDNGKKSPIAVKADKTIAIQSYKTGHFLGDGKDYVGKIKVCDIGITIVGKKFYICDSDFVRSSFPEKSNNSHKGNFGRCGIVACSENFVGAGLLAVTALASTIGECAMRVGSGYSYLFVPDKMLPAMWGRVTHACVFSHSDLLKYNLDSIAFGMGIGKNKKLFDNVADYPCVKVLDADGLNMLSQYMAKIDKFKGCVLTPHVMEFSRLTKQSVRDILQNPIQLAEQFAKKYKVVLLLKGATSVITDGEETYLNIAGNSGMAKGGSGDVLSGIIAGLLAQKFAPLKSAVLAAYIAGKTADNVKNMSSEYSMLPMDCALDVGYTLSKILKREL